MSLYRLEIAPIGGSAVPEIVRLRRLLKFALRRLGLRCVGVRQIVAARPAADQPDGRCEPPVTPSRGSAGTVVENRQ